MFYSKNFKFSIGQTNAPQHQAVSLERLDGVDAHTAHHFLDFMVPGTHEVGEALCANFRIQPFYKILTLCGDAPVAAAALAVAA